MKYNLSDAILCYVAFIIANAITIVVAVYGKFNSEAEVLPIWGRIGICLLFQCIAIYIIIRGVFIHYYCFKESINKAVAHDELPS